MNRASSIFQCPKSGVKPPKAATIRHSTFQIRHFLSPNPPSLPVPGPASVANREKQIPFSSNSLSERLSSCVDELYCRLESFVLHLGFLLTAVDV